MPSSPCAGAPAASCRSTSSRRPKSVKFDFNTPVSLGAYTLNSFDPNGKWYLWQRREDWQRTSLARFGEPGPKYSPMSIPRPARQAGHRADEPRLDVIHDIAPEGMFTLAKTKPTSGLVQGLPVGASRSDAAGGHVQSERALQNKTCAGRWRWRSTSAGGDGLLPRRATISAIDVPPTGHLSGVLLRADGGVAERLRSTSASARSSPTTRPRAADRRQGAQALGNQIRRSHGDRDPSAWAGGSPISRRPATLLYKGFKRDNSKMWLMPDGKPWKIPLSARAKRAR